MAGSSAGSSPDTPKPPTRCVSGSRPSSASRHGGVCRGEGLGCQLGIMTVGRAGGRRSLAFATPTPNFASHPAAAPLFLCGAHSAPPASPSLPSGRKPPKSADPRAPRGSRSSADNCQADEQTGITELSWQLSCR